MTHPAAPPTSAPLSETGNGLQNPECAGAIGLSPRATPGNRGPIDTGRADRLLLTLLVVFFIWVILLPPAFAEETVRRSCFGLIWCTVEQDGSVATDGFLFLYSSERKGDYSRLAIRPFYSEETDPSKGFLRRSIFWPLGSYERSGDRVSSHVVPLYWHGREPSLRYTLFLPFYVDYAAGDRSYVHLFPLYGHHAKGETYDRYFLLGPSLIVTRDTARDLTQWDMLFFLGHHRSERGRGDTWVLPIYFSGYDVPAGRSYRYLLPLYGEWKSPSFRHRFLFPLFGAQSDPAIQEHRFALFGLPPLRTLDPLPTLALYEHRTSPRAVTDRLFPLYRYASHVDEGRSEIDALLLYRHATSRNSTTDRLFPLYRYERRANPQSLQFSLFGYQELALASYHRDASGNRSHLFPLYSDQTDIRSREHAVGLIGYGPLSIYLHRTTPRGVVDRVFPLYAYERAGDALRVSVVGRSPIALYQHHTDPVSTHDVFFPVYDYESELSRRALSIIGVSELAFFRWESTPRFIRHRFFPAYAYRYDRTLDATDVSVLLLYQHHADPRRTTDRLIPLYRYTRDDAAHTREVDLLGISPLTLYRHHTSPTETTDRFFPLYGYRSLASGGTLVSALGFPPNPGGFTVALYEHRDTPALVSDRLFPVYDYSRNIQSGEVRWDALFLYQHLATKTYTKDALLPAYHYERDRDRLTSRLGVIGVPPFTLFHDLTVSTGRSQWLFPIYGYRRAEGETRLSLAGFPPLGTVPALALYEHRSRPGHVSDRVFPVYRFVSDRGAVTTSLNVLALYHHAATPERTEDVLFPLYLYTHDRTARETFVNAALLSWYRTTPVSASNGFFPLYGYRRREGETRFSLLGFPPLGDVSALAWYEHRSRPGRVTDRLFPVYRVALDRREHASRVNVLLLYDRESTPTKVRDTLFPVYRFERGDARLDVSAIGYRGFSLFRYVDTQTTLRHRVVPIYRYAHDRATDDTSVDVLLLYAHRSGPNLTADRFFPLYDYRFQSGVRALSVAGVSEFALYRHEASPNATRDRLFPLYGFRRDESGWTLGALGYPPLSLYQHESTPRTTTDRFFPLYSYQSDSVARESHVVLLGLPHVAGIPTLAIYHHDTSPHYTFDRLFPVYRYSYDAQKDEIRLGALLLFRAIATPSAVRHSLFPLYSYVNDRASKVRRVGVLGHAPLSVYQHLDTPDGTSDRLVPLYGYAYDSRTDEGRLSVLWPLFVHSSRGGRTTETGILWWLVHYERPDDGHRDFHILGGSAMAVFRHTVTPERSALEFNPILPLYYREVTPTATTWTILGGLIGREVSADGHGRMRWLWVL